MGGALCGEQVSGEVGMMRNVSGVRLYTLL